MTDLRALLERAEAASGPDREIDKDLHELLIGCVHRETKHWWIEDGNDYDSGHTCVACGKEYNEANIGRVTQSIDAGIALVDRLLPGMFWSIGCLAADFAGQDHHKFGTLVHPYFHVADKRDGLGHGATPALSTVAAVLRALIAKDA